jgi:hypothetical protein
LGKPESEVTRWRDGIREAVGADGQLIVNLIPELELIVGAQPPVGALTPWRGYVGLSPLVELVDELEDVCQQRGSVIVRAPFQTIDCALTAGATRLALLLSIATLILRFVSWRLFSCVQRYVSVLAAAAELQREPGLARSG